MSDEEMASGGVSERADNSSLLVFGSNDSCQLGLGPGAPDLVSLPSDLSSKLHVRAVAFADSHGAGLTPDGELYTWGANFAGQIGRGAVSSARTEEHATPARVQALEGWNVSSVACGAEHTVISAGAAVFCWGNNEEGQCGIGDDAPLQCPKPRLLKALRGVRVVQVAAGGHHSMALSSAGVVFTWGGNAFG